MNKKTNQILQNDLLSWKEKWHPNFSDECKSLYIPVKKTIILQSESNDNIRKGYEQNIVLDDETYSYSLSCDLRIRKCIPPTDESPCGAYISVYNTKTHETKRTQRYTLPLKEYVHLNLSFLIIDKQRDYNIGVYVDGKCCAEFANVQLQRGEHHGYSLEAGEALM